MLPSESRYEQKVNRGLYNNCNFVLMCTFYTDVRDEDGDSPLNAALASNKLDTALYLISHGCGSDEDKVKLLWRAYNKDELKMVKKLVEQHGVNPKGSCRDCVIVFEQSTITS